MSLVVADRVQETTTTTGTGTITLAGAVSGYQSFAAVGNANTTYYAVTSGTAWEVGIGTYTASGTTLARTTILSSSAGGAAITLAGTSNVYVTLPSEVFGFGAYNWIGATDANSPNVTVPVATWTPSDAATDVDAAILTKGTGALLAAVPDATSAGGDKRGTYAVDWQRQRGAATEVASGVAAVIGGGMANTASGDYSVVAGGGGDVGNLIYGNTASGDYSFVGGGYSNTADLGQSFIGGGNSNTASGTNSAIGGGASNSTQSSYAVVAGGLANIASGLGSVIGGGNNNTASGQYSAVVGGYYATTRGLYGAETFAAGTFGNAGDAQRGLYVARGSTTTATPLVLTFDAGAAGTTNQVVLPNDATYTFRVSLVARRTDANNESAAYTFEGCIDRNTNAASTALVGTPVKTILAEDTTAWDVAVSADTTNGALAITVTGQAAKTIRWVAKIETVEVVG